MATKSCLPSFFSSSGLELGTSPPLTEVSRALRARNAEKVSKMSPGASGPGTPKSPQKSQQESEKTLSTLSGDSPDCSRNFLETFRGSEAGGPGRHFRDFFGILGPNSLRDLCKGRAGSQVWRFGLGTLTMVPKASLKVCVCFEGYCTCQCYCF